MNDAATAGERKARPAPACTGSNAAGTASIAGGGREPRRVRDWAQATAEKHGPVPVETARHEKSLH